MPIPFGQYGKALESLYTDKCDVIAVETRTDGKTGRTVRKETVLLRGIPCRLSFESVSETEDRARAADVPQGVKLFLSAKHKIPPGAIIDVTGRGGARRYRRAGKSALYGAHQEIPLRTEGEWA